MKRFTNIVLLAVLLAVGWAASAKAATQEAYAFPSYDQKTLTITYDVIRSARGGTVDLDQMGTKLSYRNNITKVVIAESMKYYTDLTSMVSWFDGFTNLRVIEGLEYLRTENVTTMRNLFRYCSSLVMLDLSNFRTSNVKIMWNMFQDCSSLSVIFIDPYKWSTAKITNGSFMFSGCTSLIGGNGTKVGSNVGQTYAVADADGTPGYLTDYSKGFKVDEARFPNADLRDYLSKWHAQGGKLTRDRCYNMQQFDFQSRGFTDLKGIEYFPNIETLYCNNNNLTALDVSYNQKLTFINIEGNQIRGSSMTDFVNSLPTVTSGNLYVANWVSPTDANEMTNSQMNTATDKGWQLKYHLNADTGGDYPGPETGTPVDESNFPDANFRDYVLQNYGLKLNNDEVASAKVLRIMNMDIHNLKGIEHFTKTETLYAFNNTLSESPDLSELTALKALDLHGCNLSTIDLSNNTKLERIYLNNQQLKTVDLRNNTKLWAVWCYENQINGDGMDQLVDHLPQVSNGLLTIFRRNSSTEQNVIYKSQVAVATAKGWSVLSREDEVKEDFEDYEGEDELSIPVDAAHFPDPAFRAFVREQFGEELTEDEFGGDSNGELVVSRLGIKDLTGLEYFTDLKRLYTTDNELTSLDLSHNTKLEFVGCSENDLYSIDVTMLPLLKGLSCSDCKLTSINVSENLQLTYLGCENNQLTSLDLSRNIELENLGCHNNQLTSLDLSKNPKLRALYIESNRIEGAAMEAIVNDVPDVNAYKDVYPWNHFSVYDETNTGAQNVITKAQVERLKAKGWDVLKAVDPATNNNAQYRPYEGADETGIDAVRAAQDADAVRYNTSGQRVSENYRGLVITRDGKKVVKK